MPAYPGQSPKLSIGTIGVSSQSLQLFSVAKNTNYDNPTDIVLF